MKTRIDKEKITDTFIGYTLINTTARPGSQQLPSNDNQHKLARSIADSFLNIDNVSIDVKDNAITTITLAANNATLPSIVFFAHLDTAADHQGDTHVQRINNYQGDAIILAGTGEAFSPDAHPELRDYIGQDLLTTDGTSLLGADDKAAIAAGVEALRYMIAHPQFPHGEIKLVLLPDEEIGILGAKALDVSALNADFGICLDCCSIGEYVVENWYAGSAKLSVTGVTAHPMSAKGKLVNALAIAAQAIDALPEKERPEHTEGREGYFWPHKFSGDTAHATLDIAIRDFELQGYQARKAHLQALAADLKARWGEENISLAIQDIYDNVKPSLDNNPEIIASVTQAMKNLGITPKPLIMRGGYDGSVITPKGLPTVNIFTGAHNFHSTKEFLPLDSLRLAAEMLLEMVELSAQRVPA